MRLPQIGCTESIIFREVLLPWATARPDKFTIRRSQVGRGAQDYAEEVKEFPITGMGLHWEADTVARDIRGLIVISLMLFFLTIPRRWTNRERTDAPCRYSAHYGDFR